MNPRMAVGRGVTSAPPRALSFHCPILQMGKLSAERSRAPFCCTVLASWGEQNAPQSVVPSWAEVVGNPSLKHRPGENEAGSSGSGTYKEFGDGGCVAVAFVVRLTYMRESRLHSYCNDKAMSFAVKSITFMKKMLSKQNRTGILWVWPKSRSGTCRNEVWEAQERGAGTLSGDRNWEVFPSSDQLCGLGLGGRPLCATLQNGVIVGDLSAPESSPGDSNRADGHVEGPWIWGRAGRIT